MRGRTIGNNKAPDRDKAVYNGCRLITSLLQESLVDRGAPQEAGGGSKRQPTEGNNSNDLE